MAETSLAEFLDNARNRRVTPVVRSLFADSETPVGLYRKLSSGPGSFLLESADQGGKWSRYSFLGVAVHGTLSELSGTAVWADRGMSASEAFGAPMPESPLEALHALNTRWLSEPVPGLPPFSGGLVGHLGWEMVRLVEKLDNSPPRSHDVPSLFMSLVKDFVAIDHQTSELIVVALVHSMEPATAKDYEDALARVNALHDVLFGGVHHG